jgi:hypothetical protein
MYQEGDVRIVQCKKCKETFPVFTFVADTDMVTMGCISLSAKGNKIALTMQQSNEKDSNLEARVGFGYKIVAVRYEDKNPSAKGVSFQDFLKTYKPATSIYSCINCGSDSEFLKFETKEQFLTYGTIKVVNDSDDISTVLNESILQVKKWWRFW